MYIFWSADDVRANWYKVAVKFIDSTFMRFSRELVTCPSHALKPCTYNWLKIICFPNWLIASPNGQDYNELHYFVLWPTKAQLFHKLSHSYMFRHYSVVLRQLVINALPSYTSISNTAVGNTVYSQDTSHRFYAVQISMLKIFKTLKLSYL